MHDHLALNWHSLLLILAAVLAFLAGLNVPSGPRLNLGWFAFFCFIIAAFFVGS